MNSTKGVRSHFEYNAGLRMMLVAVAVVAIGGLATLVYEIDYRQGNVPPEFRSIMTEWAVICWAVSTLCAYVGGFITGRRYESRAD